MPIVTLPDGSKREFGNPLTVYDVAADIGSGLAKATIAGKIDGELVDASTTIEVDAELQIITDKDPEGLEVIRHSASHLMAHAVKELFPQAQVTIGPVIENGFYYDFSFERSFTPEDLKKIEKKMQELVKANIPLERSVMDRDEAIKFFNDMGEKYKAEIISDIPQGEQISLYKQGDFIDLCRGPHVPSTGKIKAFKIMKVAGAYWRGDSNNEMLQRIYGTAWPDKKQLKEYITMLAEAEKRDHRKIGKALDLFHLQEEAPGMIFWHEKGWSIYVEIMDYIRKVQRLNGYKEIHTPEIVDRILWEKSGHWDKFQENMYTTSCDERQYAIK
ncbi:MAG: TGS domain-containing protein, partial [Gammaproteobacteria bacterium]